MSLYGDLCRLCDDLGCEYLTDAVLKDYTSFKIGGKADLMIFPDSTEKLSAILENANTNNIKIFVLGKGSNLLVSDDGVNAAVINTCKLNSIELIEDNVIKCECGVSLSRLCRFALENSLSGLEFAFGIPGSAGGAAYMNAGAYGGEMKDVLISCDHINPNGTVSSYKGNELSLGYRHSAYSNNNLIITLLTLKLTKGRKEDIRSKMDELIAKRKEKQPLEFPSAGSTFKRPEGYFAGALIEQCGLKGYTCGGAQVSTKHAGFVVNIGSASARDVLNVIEHCRKTVFEKTGVMLEPEVKII